MARLVVRHPGDTECANRSAALAQALAAIARDLSPDRQAPAVELRGPSVCPIARIAGKYRRQIELLADQASDLSKVLAEARSQGLLKLGEELAVDVDPLSAV
jgi:primosomal protein N'